MADADKLSLKITTDADEASSSIQRLTKNLGVLWGVMKSLESGKGLKDLKTNLENASASVDKALKNANAEFKATAKDATTAAKAINEVKKAASKNIKPKVDTEGVKQVQKEAQKATESMKKLADVTQTTSRKVPTIPHKSVPMSDEERTRRQNEWLFGDPNKYSKYGATAEEYAASRRPRSGVKASEAVGFARENGLSGKELAELTRQAKEISDAAEPIRQATEGVTQTRQSLQEELAAFKAFAETLQMSKAERDRFRAITRNQNRFGLAKERGELEQFGWRDGSTNEASPLMQGSEQIAEAVSRAQGAMKGLAPAQQAAAESTSRLGSAFSSVRDKVSGLYAYITRYAGDLEHARASSEAFARAIGRVALRGFSMAVGAAASYLRQLSSFAKLAGLAIASFASRILAFPTRQLRNAFNIVTLGAFGKVAKNAKEASGAFQSMSSGVALGLKNIMRYVLGFRTLFYLVRAIREGIAEGFKNLAAEDERTNESLSMLTSKLTQVKNSLATAFAPVLNTVKPILETLINYVIDAINAVAQFFAALTGASTWQKATYTMSDFSAGASSAGNAADGANKSAKELRKTLLSFDKINRLNDDEGSSGSGGSGGGSGGGGGAAGAGMFTTASVATGISDFAQMVKNAWANADFTDVGKVVGEKLAEALNNIPWETIQATGEKFGKSFATFINGLVSVTELAKALGSTVGEAINTVFGTLNAFVSNLNFDAIGSFIAEAMNKGIETIKFGTIADTISKTTNGYFSVIGNWAGKFKFDVLGSVVGQTITSTLNGIEWKDAESALSTLASGIASALNHAMTKNTFSAIGTAIAGGINTAVSAADSFIQEVKWSYWGEAIATGINKFFKNVNWVGLGVSFTDAVTGLLDVLTNAIEKIDFETVGKSVADALGNVDWGKLFIKAARLVNVGLNALVTFVEALFKGIAEQIGKWFDDNLPESVKTAIEGATKIKEFIFGDEGTGVAGRTANEYGDRTATITFSGKTDASYESTKKDVNTFATNRTPVTTAKGNERDSTWTSLKKGWASVQNKTAQVTTGVAGKFSDVTSFFTKWKTLKSGKKNKKTATLNMKVEGSPGKVNEMYHAMTNIPKSKTSILTVGAEMAKNTAKITKAGAVLMDTSMSPQQKWNWLHNNGFGAKGAVLYRGIRSNIPQYAAGGVVPPSHGSLIYAGESGAEVVGHVNGRTEILNRSQMASIMYNAVLNGMSQALANSHENGGGQVVIVPDPQGIFRVVQDQANKYTNVTGKPAFNL